MFKAPELIQFIPSYRGGRLPLEAALTDLVCRAAPRLIANLGEYLVCQSHFQEDDAVYPVLWLGSPAWRLPRPLPPQWYRQDSRWKLATGPRGVPVRCRARGDSE